MQRGSVLLPDPLRPMMAMVWPRTTSRLTPSRTRNVPGAHDDRAGLAGFHGDLSRVGAGGVEYGSASRSGSRGFDCVLPLGPIGDETLIARPLGKLRMVNAASPAYLARFGVPRSLEDLQRQEHRTIHFSTMLGARPYGWEYPDGDSYATLQLPGALHVNSAQTYEAAALAGLGLIQAPLLGIGRYLESGALVEIIPDFRRRALAVSLVVAHRRNLSRRVRAFMKWIGNEPLRVQINCTGILKGGFWREAAVRTQTAFRDRESVS